VHWGHIPKQEQQTIFALTVTPHVLPALAPYRPAVRSARMPPTLLTLKTHSLLPAIPRVRRDIWAAFPTISAPYAKLDVHLARQMQVTVNHAAMWEVFPIISSITAALMFVQTDSTQTVTYAHSATYHVLHARET
jgi:hypothetical protein